MGFTLTSRAHVIDVNLYSWHFSASDERQADKFPMT